MRCYWWLGRLLAMAALLALAGCPSSGTGGAPDAGTTADLLDNDTTPELDVRDVAVPDDLLLPDDTPGDLPAPDDVAPDLTNDVPGDDVASDAADVPPDVPPPPEELIGQFNVTYWAPDIFYPWPELYAHGVFSRLLAAARLEDPVSWLNASEWYDLYVDQGFLPIPELHSFVLSDLEPWGDWYDGEGFDTLDAGLTVLFGDHIATHVDESLLEDEGVFAYEAERDEGVTLAEFQDLGQNVTLEIDGGADVSAARLESAVALVEPIEMIHPLPDFVLPLRSGRPLTFSWVPSDDPDDTVLFTALGGAAGYVIHAPDTGTLDPLDYLDQAAAYVGDLPGYTLTRIRDQTLQLAEGRVRVIAGAKVSLFGTFVGPYELWPTVWPRGETTELDVYLFDWSFDPALHQIDFGPYVELERVDVRDASHVGGTSILEIEVSVLANAPTGPTSVTVRDADGLPLLVLPDVVWIAEALPCAGICEAAVEEGFVEDGVYFGTDEGLEARFYPTLACTQGVTMGREQAVPLHLEAGERLYARSRGATTHSRLYLVRSCVDEETPAFACGEAPEFDAWARLHYAAYVAEDMLMMIDSGGSPDDDPSEYLLEIKRKGPDPFLLAPEALAQGDTATLELRSATGPLAADGAQLELGTGVSVEAVRVLDDQRWEVDVAVAPDAAAGWRDASLQIGETTHVTHEALELWERLPFSGTCEEADALGPVPSGRYVTDNTPGVGDVVDVGYCLDWSPTGPEVIHRIDLAASETLRVRAHLEDGDGVLYLMRGCEAEVLTCADLTLDPGDEVLEWTSGVEPETVYLVLDGYGESDVGRFWLELEVAL